ncbi:hypothetical protein V6N13_055760 [Hibiscus sabdariffa]
MSLTVDGAATVAKAGCGGVLRDSSANWIDKTHLIVESDSELVLEWIKEKLQRPWRWWKILYDIDCLATQIKHIKFQHIPRDITIFRTSWRNQVCIVAPPLKSGGDFLFYLNLTGSVSWIILCAEHWLKSQMCFLVGI